MLQTQPNERHCANTYETHILALPECCPRSKNPRPGSTVAIRYMAGPLFLEVASLYAYIDSFRGGRGAVRSMEGMVQTIAQDCADALRRPVEAKARLYLLPNQRMVVRCHADPR